MLKFWYLVYLIFNYIIVAAVSLLFFVFAGGHAGVISHAIPVVLAAQAALVLYFIITRPIKVDITNEWEPENYQSFTNSIATISAAIGILFFCLTLIKTMSHLTAGNEKIGAIVASSLVDLFSGFTAYVAAKITNQPSRRKSEMVFDLTSGKLFKYYCWVSAGCMALFLSVLFLSFFYYFIFGGRKKEDPIARQASELADQRADADQKKYWKKHCEPMPRNSYEDIRLFYEQKELERLRSESNQKQEKPNE